MELAYTAHVPAGEGPFPTIVALHGWGANAHDLLGLAPYLHGGQAVVLCPEGPVRVPIGEGLEGRGWFPITAGGPLDLAGFEQAVAELGRFLEDAFERFPVDRHKVILLGFSQGGVLAYDLALRNPTRFAGLVALSSWLPEALAETVVKQEEHQGFPVFVAHGSQDPMIPVQRAQESRDTLLGFGVGLTFHEYDMGHELRPETLRDLVEWLETKVVSPIQLV